MLTTVTDKIYIELLDEDIRVWRPVAARCVSGREEEELLAGAYRNSLRVAAEHRLHSLSFPSISTGAFCFPMRRAAPIALRAILMFLQTQPHELDLVRVVLYPRETTEAYSIFAEALQQIVADSSTAS